MKWEKLIRGISHHITNDKMTLSLNGRFKGVEIKIFKNN